MSKIATETPEPLSTLTILQYNINRARTTTDSILNDPTSSKIALLMLQEHYWSEYTKSPLTHHSWTAIQPTNAKDTRSRAITYINKTLLKVETYEAVPFPSNDVVALKVKLHDQNQLLVVNIYNDPKSDTTEKLQIFLEQQAKCYTGIIVGGDFNLHHPLWNPPAYHTHDSGADELINIMGNSKLQPILPVGTVTYPRAETAIDLV